MSVLEFVAALVASLVWPTIAVVALFLFKSSIADLISRITKIRYGKLDIETMQRLAGELPTIEQIDRDTENYVRRDPRSAVIEAWISLEWNARDILTSIGVERPPRSTMRVIQLLQRRGLLQGSLFELVMELRDIRNTAAHQPHIDIDSERSREYVETIERTISAIRENARRHTEPYQ